MFIRRLYLFLTELLYHQFAWAYDWVAAFVSAGLWQEWIQIILPDLSGKILELGHGPGHLQNTLLKKGFFTIGLDKSWQMSLRAKNHLQKFQLPFALVHGDALKLPFADEIFDRVVATFPTIYITKHDTLTEIHRVLRPDGRLVVLPGARIVTPNGLAGRFAAGLFHLFGLSTGWGTTAQAGAAAQAWFENPIRQAGFNLHTEQRTFQSSEIFVILATKK